MVVVYLLLRWVGTLAREMARLTAVVAGLDSVSKLAGRLEEPSPYGGTLGWAIASLVSGVTAY